MEVKWIQADIKGIVTSDSKQKTGWKIVKKNTRKNEQTMQSVAHPQQIISKLTLEM